MPDHHHMLDPQHVDGELQDGKIVRVLGRRQIGDVAVDEQLTGIEIDDFIGGHRLSEQPIQRYSGACWASKRLKNPASAAIFRAAQERFLSFRYSSMKGLIAGSGPGRQGGSESGPSS